MKERKISLVWIMVGLGVLIGAEVGCSTKVEESLPIQENFLKPLSSSWEWIRENPQTYRFDDKGLWIQPEPGSLMGEGKGVKNILVRSLPETARKVQVTVEFHAEIQYEQAGLILYRNDDQYIKLVKEFVDGEPWIVMGIEGGGKITFLNKVPITGESVTLRLEWANRTFQGFFVDAEGKKVLVGSGVFSMYPQFPMKDYPRIGLFTQNGNPGVERWARFTEMTILP